MDSRKIDHFDIPIPEEDRPATLLGDQDLYRRLEKLSQRVTIITILIPILVALIGYLVYRDIRLLVSQTQDLSAKELTAIARNLESNLSNLSINHAKLEEAFHISIDQHQTAFTQLKERVEKLSMQVDELKTVKLDKNDLPIEVNKLDSKLTAAQKETKGSIDKLTGDQKAFEKKYGEDTAKIADQLNAITTAVAECQADLGLISGEKADKKQLEVMLKGYEKKLQDIADHLSQSVESQLTSVKASIRELEKSSKAAAAPPAAGYESTPAQPPVKKPGAPPAGTKPQQP
ncbi:MAG: hypothetical protein AB1547_01740 [Thermodesulfobacteriota bacterium]